jgi:hypothetical protein
MTLEERLNILKRINRRIEPKTLVRDGWCLRSKLVAGVEWPLNRDEAFAAVPSEEKAAMPRPHGKGPTAHVETMPLVLIDGYPKRAERVSESEYALEVANAAVCIIVHA